MDIKVQLKVDGETLKEDVIHVEEHKLAELTGEEIEEVVEKRIAMWANEHVQIAWEADNEA